jgi:hypothetical protein
MDLGSLINQEARYREAVMRGMKGAAPAQGLRGAMGSNTTGPVVPGNLQIMGLMHLLNDATGGRPFADGTLDAHRHVLGVPASIEPGTVRRTDLDKQFMDIMTSTGV